MILINLLPEEYRQRRRTPLKAMAAVGLAVAINASLAGYWAWIAFGEAAEVRSELQVLQDTKTGLDPQVAYHHDLEAESAIFKSREATLDSITQQRVSWTEKTDQLIDLINAGGDGDKYLVWIDDLSVDVKENARANTYGKMKATAHSGSADLYHIANFLEDVEESEMMFDFSPPYPPSGQQTTKDEDLDPSEIWTFPFEMDLKDPKERVRQ